MWAVWKPLQGCVSIEAWRWRFLDFFYNFVENIINKKSYDRSCISWYMVTRDAFQVLKLHSPAARAILRTWKTSLVPIYHEMHSHSYDFLYLLAMQSQIQERSFICQGNGQDYTMNRGPELMRQLSQVYTCSWETYSYSCCFFFSRPFEFPLSMLLCAWIFFLK